MQTKNETDVRVHFEIAGNAASQAAEAVSDFLLTGIAPPLAMLLFREVRLRLVEASNAIGDLLTPDEDRMVDVPNQVGGTVRVSKKFADAAADAVAKREGAHRHKFGPDNRCTVATCGKVKSANGRKPAAAPAPTAEERTLPLPAAGKRLALLRPCMCTHPFSDHGAALDGVGGCAECGCETFEEPVTHANVGRPALRPLGDAAADRFVDGGQGSSGVVRR